MIYIDANTVAVQSQADLVTAVGNNAYTYIYLANNITITGGITIYAGKASLVIDGEYPQDSGAKNELTDVNSTSYLDTLGIRGNSSIALTFRNMVIHGRNYYGVPYIVETGIYNTNNVSVTYENVTYTGPQTIYNCNGLTRYIDCDITIEQTGASPAQEVGEVNRVELGGRTTIVHNSLSSGDDFAVFWFRGVAATMSLTVLEGAEVAITSRNCYFMYNMEPTWGTAYPLPYAIRAGASLTLQADKGISFNSSNQVSSFRLEAGASFRYIQTANNGTAASVYINGALSVGEGASFYMQAANSTQPLIQFTSGAGRSLTLDNPLSFVLYCANNPALISLATTQLALRGGQLNTWRVPTTPVESAGGLDDTPEYKWFKRDYALPVEFTGTFTQTATTVTGNLAQEDEPYPPLADLHMHEARVVSMGDWLFMASTVEDDGRAVTGWSYPGSRIRVIYTIEGVTHTLEGTTGEDGRFSIDTSGETPPNMPAGTPVTILSNIPFLIKEISATSIETGTLLITSAPQVIEFTLPPISTGPVLLPRVDPLEPVVVQDDRADRSAWELSASIAAPLQTEFGDILPDAVVFLESAGAELITLDGMPTVVRTGGDVPGPNPVFWPVEEGILIRVTQPMRLGVKYSTLVNWELHASVQT